MNYRPLRVDPMDLQDTLGDIAQHIIPPPLFYPPFFGPDPHFQRIGDFQPTFACGIFLTHKSRALLQVEAELDPTGVRFEPMRLKMLATLSWGQKNSLPSCGGTFYSARLAVNRGFFPMNVSIDAYTPIGHTPFLKAEISPNFAYPRSRFSRLNGLGIRCKRNVKTLPTSGENVYFVVRPADFYPVLFEEQFVYDLEIPISKLVFSRRRQSNPLALRKEVPEFETEQYICSISTQTQPLVIRKDGPLPFFNFAIMAFVLGSGLFLFLFGWWFRKQNPK